MHGRMKGLRGRMAGTMVWVAMREGKWFAWTHEKLSGFALEHMNQWWRKSYSARGLGDGWLSERAYGWMKGRMGGWAERMKGAE